MFIGGDNAYPLSDYLVVPFSGAYRFDEDKRILNFFLSQLRIRIEMAFGRLTTKCRIFRSNLNFSLEKNIRICNVASRLHNFVIDQQETEDLGSLEGTETTDQLRTMGGIEQFSDPRSPENLGFPPNHEHPEQLAERPPQNNQQDEGMDDLMDGAMDDLMEDETSVIYINLSRRDSILDYIQDLELERPDKNRSRNDN